MNLAIGWYGIAVFSVLLIKLLLSLRPRRPRALQRAAPGMNNNLHAIITLYNEDPGMIDRCLSSLLRQTVRPAQVTVVDDGSHTLDALQVVRGYVEIFRAAGMDLWITQFPQNLGKRHGLAHGFNRWEADVYLCIDSDTVLEPDAVACLMPEFDDPDVHSVTGLVLAHNRSRNLLTRLIDMRYQCAFLGERVAYSRFGSVLCACGSLVAYRGWVVRQHLEDFITQRFLGAECTYGDDRRLTYYALTEGKSVIQPAACAYTDVPSTLRKYLSQQLRWTKSFIRESVLLALKFRVRKAYWWLNLLELATWCAFTSGLIVAVASAGVGAAANWEILGAYAVYVSGASYVRSLHYLRRADLPTPPLDRYLTFLAAPAYALMNLTLLLPLRLYALVTLRRNGWGTRSGPVEA